MNLQPGQIFADKYRIVRLIGQGGMGTVFEGENIRIRRKVAIKTLHAAVAEKGDVVTRFEREAQAAGRIGSAHIVEVLDLGDLPDGSRFMVMEYLEGVTLEHRIRSQGRLAPADAVPIIMQLLDGLGAAHQAGIVHRDLKPANVFLLHSKGGQADFVKILDFGVSKFSVLNADEMSMTRTGSVVGTPFYMSPEQAKGAKGLDGRSDLYAVGVILYECITGQVPFHAETFNELIFKIVLESPPPAESFVPDLDPSFAALIRRAMSREITERFQSALELKQALAEWAARFARGTLPGPGGTTALLPPGAAWGPGLVAGAAPPATTPHPGAVVAGGYPPPAFGAASYGGAPSPCGGYVAPLPAGGGVSGAFGVEDPIAVPKKGAGGLIAAVAFIAVIGLGGGGFAAYRWSLAREAATQPVETAATEGDAEETEEPTSDETGEGSVDETDTEGEDEASPTAVSIDDLDEAEPTNDASASPTPESTTTAPAPPVGTPTSPTAPKTAALPPAQPTGAVTPPPAPSVVNPPPPPLLPAASAKPPRTVSDEL